MGIPLNSVGEENGIAEHVKLTPNDNYRHSGICNLIPFILPNIQIVDSAHFE